MKFYDVTTKWAAHSNIPAGSAFKAARRALEPEERLSAAFHDAIDLYIGPVVVRENGADDTSPPAGMFNFIGGMWYAWYADGASSTLITDLRKDWVYTTQVREFNKAPYAALGEYVWHRDALLDVLPARAAAGKIERSRRYKVVGVLLRNGKEEPVYTVVPLDCWLPVEYDSAKFRSKFICLPSDSDARLEELHGAEVYREQLMPLRLK